MGQGFFTFVDKEAFDGIADEGEYCPNCPYWTIYIRTLKGDEITLKLKPHAVIHHIKK